MNTKHSVFAEFLSIYGGEARSVSLFHSPGRVNLIGEHTDYNGGLVFPCALDIGTFGAARRRDDNVINLASADFELRVSASIDGLRFDKARDWANYPLGVVKTLADEGFILGGADVYIADNIPNGAGLSSSASIEVLTCAIFERLYGISVTKERRAAICHRAEREFVGVNCGVTPISNVTPLVLEDYKPHEMTDAQKIAVKAALHNYNREQSNYRILDGNLSRLGVFTLTDRIIKIRRRTRINSVS